MSIVYRDHQKKFEQFHEIRKQHEDLSEAMTAFIRLLKNHTDITKATIPADALKKALDQVTAT